MIQETEELVAPKVIKWANDPCAESQMKGFALTWTIIQVELSQIDATASYKHTGRLDAPVDNELAEEYAAAMSNGDVFPRIVVTQSSRQKYIILGGNTRYAALKLLGAKMVEAYLVDIKDQERMEMFPRVLNRAHGKRTSREEAIKLAVIGCTKYGWPLRKASEMLKISKYSIEVAIKNFQIRETLESKGLNTTSIPASTISVLARIPNENVLLPTARLVVDAGLTADETIKIVREVNAARRSELDMLSKVSELTKQYIVPPIEKNGPVSSLQRKIISNLEQNRREFLRFLVGLEKCLFGKRSLKQFGFSNKEESIAVRGRLLAASEKFSSFFE